MKWLGKRYLELQPYVIAKATPMAIVLFSLHLSYLRGEPVRNEPGRRSLTAMVP